MWLHAELKPALPWEPSGKAGKEASARAVYSPYLCIIVIRVSGNSRETYVKTNKLLRELTHGDREIDTDVKRWIFSP